MLCRDEHFATIITEVAPFPSSFLQRLVQRDRDIAGLIQAAHHLDGVTHRVEPKLPPDILGLYVYLP